MTAYVEYDPDTLIIKKVSWKKSVDTIIEIDDSLAEDFILGRKNLSSWFISMDSGQHILIPKPTHNIIKCSTTTLLTVNHCSDSNVDIIIDNNSVKICGLSEQYNILYITKKDDPSWLSQSIELKQLNIENNEFFLEIPDADRYSYFLGR